MTISDLKKVAITNKIPIIKDGALNYILTLIKDSGFKSVLEIGSAIGYSALCFAAAGCQVLTIEKDDERYQQAVKNIEMINPSVKVIHGDASLVELGENHLFDLIFIDAAKGQYTKFFARFEKHLAPNGVIICDNLNFHNLDPNQVSPRTKSLLKKIADFKTWLRNNILFNTEFINVGDGLSISRRKV